MTNKNRCQHVWIYNRKDDNTLYVKCARCGTERPTKPGEWPTNVGQELNIRHDDRDGDV